MQEDRCPAERSEPKGPFRGWQERHGIVVSIATSAAFCYCLPLAVANLLAETLADLSWMEVEAFGGAQGCQLAAINTGYVFLPSHSFNSPHSLPTVTQSIAELLCFALPRLRR